MFLFKLFQTLKSSAHPILINFEITEVSSSFNIPPLSLQKKIITSLLCLVSHARKLTKTLKYYVSDDKRIVKSSFLCRTPYTICYGFFYVFHFWPVIMSFNKPIVFCLLHKHNKKRLVVFGWSEFLLV